MANPFTTAQAASGPSIGMQMMAPDLAAQQMQLARQQQYADLLRKQSIEPSGGTEMVSGWAVKKSPLEGLAKMAQALGANYSQNNIDEKQIALSKALRESGNNDMNAVMDAMQGTPARAGIAAPSDAAGGGPGFADQPAVAGDRRAAMALALQSQNPTVQGVGSKLMEAELKPAEGVVINGQLVNKFNGNPMGGVIPKQEEAYTLSPGAVRFGADGKQLAAVADPNKPFNANGTENAGFQAFEIRKHKAGAPSVNVKTDVKMGESLGAQVGPMMKDSTAIAEGAVKQVDAAGRIIKAVDNGNMITGPTANARLKISQVSQMLGIGGKDEAEKIANTRATIRGLAELTLQGRQQMKGQGAITESESALAEKAMSGKLEDLTAAELKQLAKASDRAARFNYGEHQRKMKVMQSNPALQGIAPFYEGPQMPPEAATPTSASFSDAEKERRYQAFKAGQK
jgi:hypothetical protein